MPVCKLCEANFPNRMLIDGKKRNLGNRQFCLDCSPFNAHNTKQLINPDNTHKICSKCGIDKDITEFYTNKKYVHGTLCKECYTIKCRDKMHRSKERAVKMLGGKCILCGYNETNAALSFHHINPDEKDHGMDRLMTRSFENVVNELNKCVLLCIRCHFELHHSHLNESHSEKVIEWKKAHPLLDMPSETRKT